MPSVLLSVAASRRLFFCVLHCNQYTRLWRFCQPPNTPKRDQFGKLVNQFSVEKEVYAGAVVRPRRAASWWRLHSPRPVVRPVAAGDGAAYFSRSLRRASALPLAVMALAVAARLVFGVAPGYGADANHTLIIPTIGEFVNPESNPAPALPGHRPLPFLAPTPPAPAAQSAAPTAFASRYHPPSATPGSSSPTTPSAA